MAAETSLTTVAEYVWVADHDKVDIRSKTRIIRGAHWPNQVSDLPLWNFDGSSTGQAPTERSEVVLRPVAMYLDPLRNREYHDRPNVKCLLILCECLRPDGTPLPNNTRTPAVAVFGTAQAVEDEPWFGLEQEYTLMAMNASTPLAWHMGALNDCIPSSQGKHYCGTVSAGPWGRDVAEHHMRACIVAGLTISGINAEVLPGQWEFQIGPCTGIDAADELWIARFLLCRVAELYKCVPSFNPKPVLGDWNGSGCHVNFSTRGMRAHGGYDRIVASILALAGSHETAMQKYGIHNDRRLTGHHETSSMTLFTHGVADRSASVRIPSTTFAEKKGYYEDRRPAANMDPYIVTSFIYQVQI